VSDTLRPTRRFETRTARWRAQRWLLDATIAAQGVDWDVPRTGIYGAPCGPEGMAEFALVAGRIRKFDDIRREYAAAAARREARAMAQEAEGRSVAAREGWFIAAQLRAASRWAVFDSGPDLLACDAAVRAAYTRFAALADRPVEAVEVPFQGGHLPGWLHLPRAPAPGERFPCLVQLPGMDNNKEQMVALYGDKYLSRGIAVLALDGPGQAESIGRGFRAGPESHGPAGPAVLDFLRGHPAIDAARVAIRGVSFGSYFAIQMAEAAGEGFRACVAAFVAHEPGLRTLWEAAPPSFKNRFMMMAGEEDEAAFDRLAPSFDLRPVAACLRTPLLVLAGEDDELSPVEHTEAMLRLVPGPSLLVVYEGAKHVLRGAAATVLGENPDTLTADWVADRLRGEAAPTGRWMFAANGQLRREPAVAERPP
jgi:pimeloyl-ACP methyl ester carboxylesterase